MIDLTDPMDPAKQRFLPEQLSEKAEAWLRYYQDIGIRTFFRDRNYQDRGYRDRADQDAPAVVASAAPKKPLPATPVVLPATTLPSKSAPAASLGTAGIQAGPLLHGIAPGPSLFEAVERIVGDTLERISSDIGECTRCKLHRHRNKIVFGAGNPRAELVFVGEGPGHDEDMQGLPFVGRAGKLLTQMIEAMGLRREDVYIANVVKCRPPENRAPEKDEESTCMPFLIRQLGAIEPKVIVCLGNVAMQALLGKNKGISHLRGQWFDFRGARLIPTYHPAYLLRNPQAKADVWVDLKKVMALLGLKPPKPGQRGKHA